LQIIEQAKVGLKCPRCTYAWLYNGHLDYASCPSCRYNIKVSREQGSSRIRRNSEQRLTIVKQRPAVTSDQAQKEFQEPTPTALLKEKALEYE